jgi:tetratricopeptide (TPR) repeat protein
MSIKWTFILVLVLFCSCSNTKRQDPTAKSLNDSIIRLTNNYQDTTKYKEVMSLVQHALKIDSNYFKTYSNKLYFEEISGKFDSASETLKRMIKLKPDSADLYLKIGLYEDIIGDTVEAQEYYRRSLPRYTILIDTLKKNNPERHNVFNMLYMNMILMKQEKMVHDILKENSETELNGIYLLTPILKKTRNEIIDEARKKYFR